MKTITTVIKLGRSGTFMAKSHQKYVKFNYNNELYQYNSIPSDYTEGPRKFTKPLPVLMREKNALVEYFDDIFTQTKNFRETFDNVKMLTH